MRTLFVITFILTSILGHAQGDAFKAGNTAYADGNFELALEHYEGILNNDLPNANLYYNLGNTYFELEELGKAIWSYKMALKLSPDHPNALHNLKLSETKLVDNISSDESMIFSWIRVTFFSFSVNFWAYLSVFAIVFFAVAFFIYRTAKEQRKKNIALFGGIFTLGAWVICIGLAYFHYHHLTHISEAIIIPNSVSIKTAPSETSEAAFNLYEGTTVTLLRDNTDWVEISLNDNTGWILKEDIWKL